MSSFGSFDSGGTNGTLSEISMVPLIDVMLVVFVIFLIAGALLMDLLSNAIAHASTKDIEPQIEVIDLAEADNGLLFLNENAFVLDDLIVLRREQAKLAPQPDLR